MAKSVQTSFAGLPCPPAGFSFLSLLRSPLKLWYGSVKASEAVPSEGSVKAPLSSARRGKGGEAHPEPALLVLACTLLVQSHLLP